MIRILSFSLFLFVSTSYCFGQICGTPPTRCGTVPNVIDHYSAVEYYIGFPPTWKLDTSGLLETQFIVTSPKENDQDAFRENVSLKVKDSENLHNFVVGSENWIRNNGTLLESRRRINDRRQEYHVMVYTLQEQPNLVYEQYYFFKYKFLYELTFVQERSSFMANRSLGENVLNSFYFKFP